jgi:membrane protein YqaA with SNARE-associated domain
MLVADAALLMLVSFVGTVIWPVSPDAAVLVYVAGADRPVLEAALLATAGQAVMFVLLHHLGHRLRARWRWLDARCEKVRARWGARLQASTIPVAGASGLLGLPPSVPVVLLAAALGLPARVTLPAMIACRIAWFVGLGLVGSLASDGTTVAGN